MAGQIADSAQRIDKIAIVPVKSKKRSVQTSKTRKSAAPRAKKPVEYFTAEDIQRVWREENGSQRPKSVESAIDSQRGLRDRKEKTKKARRGKIEVLYAKKLSSLPWLVHGFSTRQGGESEEYGGFQLNLGYTKEDQRDSVEKNRKRFLIAMGATRNRKPLPLVNLSQIHSAIIHRVGRDRKVPSVGDGLITNVPGVVIAVKTADCIPVIVVDRQRKAVGAFHAGWRGTTQRIVEKGIGEMRKHFGSDTKDLVAVIGPGISKCCYAIGNEVENEFESQFVYSHELFENVFDSWALHTKYPLLFLNQRAPGHGEPALSRHLDLIEANRRQLLDAGVPAENIESLDLCTACRTDMFFSHRKEHVTGRMMAAVGIK